MIHHAMPDREFYGILAGWVVLAGAFLLWVWHIVRKADRKAQVEEAKQIELDADWDEWVSQLPQRDNTPAKVVGLPKGKEKGFQARSRRAESLGFKDDEPPKRSA